VSKPVATIHKRPLVAVVYGEIFYQFGDAAKYFRSPYDQYRIYTGFNYEVFKNIKVDLAYCYVSQQRIFGRDTDVQNAICAFVTFGNFVSRFTK